MFEINVLAENEKSSAQSGVGIARVRSLRSYKNKSINKDKKRTFSLKPLQTRTSGIVAQPLSPTNSIYTELDLPDDQAAIPGFLE